MINPAQEDDTIPKRRVIIVGLGAVLATCVGVLVAYLIGAYRTRDLAEGTTERASREHSPDVSNIETTPFVLEAQGIDQRMQAKRFLSTYGWVDKDKDLVHVPIDVATELYLQKRLEPPSGLHARGGSK